MQVATARANANIAFIKYWGNIDNQLRLPASPSISMNIDGIHTETTVQWDDSQATDVLILNGKETGDAALHRVSQHLDVLRKRLGLEMHAIVESANNFPTGAGIASSASAFSALTLAGVTAAGVELDERELSMLARLGSGSASRSIPDGFVEWHVGKTHETSYAESVAPADHWDIVDVIAIVSRSHKRVSSRQGHETAETSDLQEARLAGAEARLRICRRAILEQDFDTFQQVVEHDSNLMHAVMMTSIPPLFYWLPASLALMADIRDWRADGLQVCYTLDAGPNVHCICTEADAPQVIGLIQNRPDIQEVRVARPGQGARIITKR